MKNVFYYIAAGLNSASHIKLISVSAFAACQVARIPERLYIYQVDTGGPLDETTTKALQMAQTMIKAGKQEQAADILVMIVRSEPNLEEAWFLLGFALMDTQKRIDSFQQVLRINPNHEAARQQLHNLQSPKFVAPFTEDTPTVPQNVFMAGRLRQAGGEPVVEPGSGTQALSEARKQFNAMQREPEQAASAQPEFPRALDGSQMQTAPRMEFEPDVEPPPAKKRIPTYVWIMAGIAALVVFISCLVIWWLWRSAAPAAVLPTATPPAQITPSPTSLPATPSSTPAPLFSAEFRGTACSFSIPLGTRVRCGLVKVPRDRAKNFSDLIDLPVVLFQSSKAGADVIVILQGGPGQPAIDWSLANFDGFVTPLLDEYDVLFFDPRGAGSSSPALACPELNSVFLDSYFKKRDDGEAFAEFKTLWAKCRERFTAEGLDPAVFNTTESAGDVRDIAQAMGYEKINLLGISYGTRLGLTVMRDYPELVRAAVLDSVVPLQAKMVNRRASDMEYALQKVFNDCAASPQCNTAYPELERVFNNLLVRYNQKPVTVRAYDAASGFERDIKVNGVDFLNAMGWGLHTSELVPVLPKAIYDIEQGDTTFLSFALGIPGGEYSSLALGTYFATVCSEQVYASSTEQLDADLNVSPLFKEYALSGFFGSSQRAFDLCQVLGARAYDPRDGQPVTANIPSLVFSGQYDPFTPPLTGELLAADLPDSHFYVVPGMGHAATIGNACSFSILMEFLKDPAQAPDAACLQRATFEFFLPYDGKQPIALEALNDPAQLLRGMVPAGWKRDPHALSYSRHAYLFDPTQVTYTTFAAPQYMAFTKLVDSFESVGFDGPPKRMADHLANDLLWTTYLGKYKGGPVLIALAEVSKSQTLAVVMVVTEKERSAFYDGLFLPILDAYAPK